jgi:hypothetical protein
MYLPLYTALREFEAYVGQPFDWWTSEKRPIFANSPMPFPKHRSLTAVALATSLERSGLGWKAIDPGIADLNFWRKSLQSFSAEQPKTIAISTSHIMTAPWARALCLMIRTILPDSKIILGGAYYSTNATEFLSLDADVFCVGEGEVRLPQIVSRLATNEPLDDIPGLYLGKGNGSLIHTGHTSQLRFEGIMKPDWALASRIDPPVDLATDNIEFGVETQRGCPFKCEFCAFRTLASPDALSVEASVEAILTPSRYPGGCINIVDPTATFPHNRWKQILELLAERGGSRHPIWAFARVSDISPLTAKLMAKAGVRQVFIGQESGDQSILNLMKKGTTTLQVEPAIAALREHGVSATFSFMHGFPGESIDSIKLTRQMIAGLNKSSWDRPTVESYLIYPFLCLDFANVAHHDELSSVNHYYGYDSTSISAKRAAEEVLATIIAVSRTPHAPVFGFFFGSCPPTTGISLFGSELSSSIFRWLKACERGSTIFLERKLEGRSRNEADLPRIKEEAIRHLKSQSLAQRALFKGKATISSMVCDRLTREWKREPMEGPGWLTRATAGMVLGLQLNSLKLAWDGWVHATVPASQRDERTLPHGEAEPHTLARDLTTHVLTGQSPN